MGQQMPPDQAEARVQRAKLFFDLSAFEELPPAVTVGGEAAASA
ncbi:Uncharacterised protein [Mycobacterium tuberculosis]|nr:Uncharacterised protein [Mycobacterium tuberculosis]